MRAVQRLSCSLSLSFSVSLATTSAAAGHNQSVCGCCTPGRLTGKTGAKLLAEKLEEARVRPDLWAAKSARSIACKPTVAVATGTVGVATGT